MKNKTIILLVALCLSFVSCEKFLDLNPKNEVVNDDMFSSKEGIESTLYGVYGAMKSKTLYGENLSFGIPEILANNLKAYWVYYFQHFMEYDYTHVESVNQLLRVWTNAYEVIAYCNNIIQNLEDLDPESYSLYDLYLGEAYGLRAFMHFELMKYFAPHVELYPNEEGIPYSTSYSFEHPSFYTVSQVYERIIADLKKAQELLIGDTEFMTYPRADFINGYDIRENFQKARTIHFNYYAATGTLARAYWMKGDYDKAATEAYKVINSEAFPLVTKDNVYNLMPAKLNGKETIWGIYSTDYITQTTNRLANISTGSAFTIYTPEGNNFTNYTQIYSQYSTGDGSNDNRYSGWFGDPEAATGEEDTYTTTNLLKLFNDKSISNAGAYNGYYDGISMMRIPEMYYIAAEAAIRNGSSGEATILLNAVLESRGLIALDLRNPVLVPDLDMLYNERHKEFFGEGMRWLEMKKMNMDIESNSYYATLPASNDYYVFPIPNEEYEYRND